MSEVKRLRTERGLTQRELCDLAGIDKVTLIKVEHGRGKPTVRTLEKLAGALNVELADLLPRAQSPLLNLDEEDEALVRDLMQRVKADELSVVDALDAMRASGILQPRRRTVVQPERARETV